MVFRHLELTVLVYNCRSFCLRAFYRVNLSSWGSDIYPRNVESPMIDDLVNQSLILCLGYRHPIGMDQAWPSGLYSHIPPLGCFRIVAVQ